ncbi:stonin-2 isoform X2 [Denticeps clupeoides]|uniref:stonin-2 isoform X2 n=1 Tax=Denticeps clupeoides TaxID=299321 RepID=UPI0010A41E72|nr:stonin-2 isoform X2 [Denticeps clupeoides]
MSAGTHAADLRRGDAMAAATSSRTGAARPGWVAFAEEPSQSAEDQQTGPRHSVCSSASFWSTVAPSESSFTTQSEEHSSVSMGESSCDLPSLGAEEPSSRTPSRPHSPGSSVFQDDEGVSMDPFNWNHNKHTNGQSHPTSTTRFASWVTFDDEEEEESPHTDLDNLYCSPIQDSNSNVIQATFSNQVAPKSFLDTSPDGSNPAFVFQSPQFYTTSAYDKKNPFFDEDFSNIQPSPINPFSSFFNEKEQRKSQSNSSCLNNISSNSPFFQPSAAESIIFFSPVEESQAENDVFGLESAEDDLDKLRNMQITDPDDGDGLALPDDPVDADECEDLSYKPPHMDTQEGWPMLLRIPEKKNIMSSRHWGPIFVRLNSAGLLHLYYEKGLEKPFKEFQLNVHHEISEAKLQNYDDNGRVHTLSVDHVVFKEKRRIQPKVTVVHQPVRDQLVKLGTTSYQDFLSFRHALQEVLVGLPVETISPSPQSYSEEEAHVEVRDDFYGLVSKGDCRILEQLVVTRINGLFFTSDSPSCRIGLNDVQVKGKEVVSRHDIIPNTTTRWIRLRDCQLHKSADQSEFQESRVISFSPPSGHRFELLRFRTTFAEKTLPFTLRTVANVRGAEVELQSWLVMSTGFSSNRDPLTLVPCENVMVRYPIPDLWAKNFRRESVTGEKSLKARFNKGASFGSVSTSGAEPAMRVTLGSAKYEHAFKSVVWRISRLPDKNSALGHPHTFFCHLELGSDWEVPPQFRCQLEVEFDMPAASASKATVRSLRVGEKTDMKKWITYKSHFYYKVAVDEKCESDPANPGPGRPGECTQQ